MDARPPTGVAAADDAPARDPSPVEEAGGPLHLETPTRTRTVPTVGLLLAAFLGLALAMFAGAGGGVDDTGPTADLAAPVLGDPDAPVVMVEYSDFVCPYCQRHALQVKPRLIADYIDTGIVRYEWRDLPLQGQESVNAALAARAAQEQGRFWEYHAGLFQRSGEGFSSAGLRRLAGDVGLDLEQFDDALSSGRHGGLVQADAESGTQLGITGTPAFVINGTLVVGAQGYDVFAEVIEAARGQADA